MKKILTILTVALLACSTVFAAVNFSGAFVAGYNFNYNNAGSEDWGFHVMGQDGDDSNTTKLNLGFADDNGVWSIGLEGQFVADGRLSGDISIDMMKLLDVESDVALKVALAVNDEQSVLRAYSNNSGNNFDRFRTAAGGLWTSVNVGYSDFVQVQVAGAPNLEGYANGDKPGQDDSSNSADHLVGGGDLAISALVTPVDGVKVSGGWVLNGKDDNGTGTEGVAGGAVDVNVGTLAGLDFDLGVSASYKYGFGTKTNVVAATVYGGVDVVDFAVEWALQGETNYLYAGVNLNVVENMLLDVYVGANDIAEFGDTFFVGGDVGYTIKDVTLALGIEYAGTGANGGAYNYDYTGLSIVPKVSVSF